MGTPPRGFNREQSAEYVGVSATKFDQMVSGRPHAEAQDGSMGASSGIDCSLTQPSRHCPMTDGRGRCLEQDRGMMDPAAMVTVKLRYVHQDMDRHGNVRTYFWRKGGPKVRIARAWVTRRSWMCIAACLRTANPAGSRRQLSARQPRRARNLPLAVHRVFQVVPVHES